MDLIGAETHVRAVTGRSTTRDALGWLEERRRIAQPIDVPSLLKALVLLSEDRGHPEMASRAEAALKVVCRNEVRSELDPSKEVLALDRVTKPEEYRAALDEIASLTVDRTLATITLAAVNRAQAQNPFVMETLCAIAALSFRDLRDRAAKSLPTSPYGRWGHDQVKAAWDVVDAIVSGTVTATSRGAHPMRPVEHLLHDTSATGGRPTGWAYVERLRIGGVCYELLLAQRAVGSAWGAHRNRTNGLVPLGITDSLCELLDDLRVPYSRIKRNAASRELLARVGAEASAVDDEKAEGGQVTVLVHTPAGFAHAVAVSVARDGGTARKSGPSLARLVRRLGISCSVIVVGPGWALRNETVDLARAFKGRVYTERTLDALAAWLHTHAVGGGSHTSGGC